MIQRRHTADRLNGVIAFFAIPATNYPTFTLFSRGRFFELRCAGRGGRSFSNKGNAKMKTASFLGRMKARIDGETLGKVIDYAVPVAAVALLGGAAIAGADTTFDTALTKFSDFLEGSGGKIITVLSLAGGVVGLASGRFSMGQIAIPVGVGVGAGTGIPIVTSTVTATI